LLGKGLNSNTHPLSELQTKQKNKTHSKRGIGGRAKKFQAEGATTRCTCDSIGKIGQCLALRYILQKYSINLSLNNIIKYCSCFKNKNLTTSAMHLTRIADENPLVLYIAHKK
jgi:hypothetical protein